MKNRQWLWLTAISLLAGCSGGDGNTPTEVDPNVCTPRCGWGYQCIEGQCIENSKVCDPACTAGFECVDNTCVESKLICHEPCADDTTCVAGECIPNTRICNLSKCDETGQNCTQEQIACSEDELCINDACIKATEYCDPACDSDTQQCVNNQCVFVEPYCDGKAENRCNEDLTRACSTETTPAQWVQCEEYQACQNGKCILKTDFECDPTQCSDNKTTCYQGKRVACNAAFELCENNECIIIPTATCTPETCLSNAEQFICNDKAKPEKCPNGQRCQDGKCFTAVADSAVHIWDLCEDDSDCGAGKCLKKVEVGLNANGSPKEVYLYSIDSRITQGKGICSADCSKDATVCDGLAHEGEAKWTCQIIQEGQTPYTTNSAAVDQAALAAGTPFAAVCRPPQDTEAGWSQAFCGYCDEQTPCADGYKCVDNMCMEPCVSDKNCPILFSCKDSAEARTKVCQPIAGACGQCKDKDGDGSGVGHCEKTGVDCNENDPTIFFTTDKPALCEKADRNCNGISDDTELIGSDEHCSACGVSCEAVTQHCNAGKCEYTANYCAPGICSNDRKSRCPDTPNAQWVPCATDELCVNNECIKASTHCEPACDSTTQVCINNQCVFMEPYCDGRATNLCSEDSTRVCSRDTTPAKWNDCKDYETCQNNRCVLKPELECNPTQCADTRTACVDGKKVACNSTFESCIDNTCVIKETATCTPETCPSNAEQFICNDRAKPEKCPDGKRCQDGKCFTAVAESEVQIWNLCEGDSDCSTGKCIKKVEVGLNENGSPKEVYLYTLDRRIAQGKGICSENCTNDASVCDSLAHTGENKWTCQIIQEGRSPYTTNIANIDESVFAAGTPFAAICRPPQNTDAGWSQSFCGYCDDQTPCADGYRCVNNICMEPCVSDQNCPLLFSCKDSAEARTKVCQPIAGVCGQCDDKDGDGSGIGHCEKAGIDCNENDKTIFYSTEKPALCEKIDRNCNGIMDDEELLNSDEHCSACNAPCTPTTQQCNSGKCEYIANYCEQGTCSENGKSFCPQTTLAEWVGCNDYESCRNGMCQLTVWQTCSENAECSNGMECLKSVIFNNETIVFSELDSHIPNGYGVCSKDCTDDKDICGNNATCQLLKEGEPLWNNRTAIYPLNMSEEALSKGTPFVSICRPEPRENEWDPSFCRWCDDSTPCTGDYRCVKNGIESWQTGVCLAPCNTNDDCPLFQKCDTIRHTCTPISGYCLACRDDDNDKSGVGHCAIGGYDCDDTDPESYYKQSLPTVCSAQKDTNCNGRKDDTELLHSDAHCSACGDRCDAGKTCIPNGDQFVCMFDPDGEFCAPGTCTPDKKKYCSDKTTPAKWAECGDYKICENGQCILDPEYSCSPSECHDSYTGCEEYEPGKFQPISCDKNFEICNAGSCVINTEGEHANCTANTCFENENNFFCNAQGTPEKCPQGTRCQGGECVMAIAEENVNFWTICTDDYECPFGKCLKEITLANTNTTIKLSEIDSRIKTSRGICTLDCTEDKSICDEMTVGDQPAFSCQLIYQGQSPWPSTPVYPMDNLNLDAVIQGVPFAAVCRPATDTSTGWDDSFCKTCRTNSDCSNAYQCVDGACLPPCENNSHCPVLFACQDSVCKPTHGGSCKACLDRDGDGSGVGHCPKRGLDCNDNDASIYYSYEIENAKLASACVEQDKNCDGLYDRDELIGTVYHCTECGMPCGDPDGDIARHIVDTCVQSGNAFACERFCDDGYAFENGRDVTSGCTKIVDIQPAIGIPVENFSGKTFGIDKDGDGYATSDKTWDIWCYKDVCYGLDPQNDKAWTIRGSLADMATNYPEYIELTGDKLQYRDCNDVDNRINPSEDDICDGIDNNCDGVVDAGSAEITLTAKYHATTEICYGIGDNCTGVPLETNSNTETKNIRFGNTADSNAQGSGIIIGDECRNKNYHVFRYEGAKKTCDATKLYDAQNNPNGCESVTNPGDCKGYFNYTNYIEDSCYWVKDENNCDANKCTYTPYGLLYEKDRSCEATGVYTCERVYHRSADPANPGYYAYEVTCAARNVKSKSDKDPEEWFNGQDNDCDGIVDDGYINSVDSTCPYQAGWKLVDESKATLAQKKESCEPKNVTESDKGICRTGHKVAFKGTPASLNISVDDYSNTCIKHTAAVFDFIGDKTDTNCDGFEGDLQRTLFVAAYSANYGAGVENPDDAQTPERIRSYTSNTANNGLHLHPLATLHKAIELAQTCMQNGVEGYNGAGCSRICFSTENTLDAWYCDDYPTPDKPTYDKCKTADNCEAFLLPWDIVITQGTFNEDNVDFNISYENSLPTILIEDNGFQHRTVTEINGFTYQNVLPGNAVWRIFGGATISTETWTIGSSKTNINIRYTGDWFNSPEDISVFHSKSSEKLHLYMSQIAVDAKASGPVTDDYLYEDRSPATLIGIKSLNTGRLTLSNTTFTLTAPNGSNAPTMPQMSQYTLAGRDGNTSSNLTASTLFANDAFREWRRKHEKAALNSNGERLRCPNGEYISAGGTGAVSPYSVAAFKTALEQAKSLDIVNQYYCPAEDLDDWYLYNFGNMGGDDYLKKTGTKIEFVNKTGNTILSGQAQCAKEEYLLGSIDENGAEFNVYNDYVGYDGETCFGSANTPFEMKNRKLSGGRGGASAKYDASPMALEIEGSNFNFRNAKLRDELKGQDGENGLGGAGAPAFTVNNVNESSILRKYFGPQSVYALEHSRQFCDATQQHYADSIARAITMTYLAAIRVGVTQANQLAPDRALIVRGAGGGTGGCGGLGGEAGYPGGSSIGLIISPDAKISFTNNSTFKINAGNGGNGADGQNGMAGGKGGKGLSFTTSDVPDLLENNEPFPPLSLNTVHGQSGSGGGGGGAGANGKPGYALGILVDCSRYRSFDECRIMDNDYIRGFNKSLITTVLGKTRNDPADAGNGTDADAPTTEIPVATVAGSAGRHNGSAVEHREVINNKTLDAEKVYSDEKLTYIYLENGARVIGSNTREVQ